MYLGIFFWWQAALQNYVDSGTKSDTFSPKFEIQMYLGIFFWLQAAL
jgi:hypothetical protein